MAFKDILLLLAGERLNMCLCEYFQLQGYTKQDLKKINRTDLIELIITDIAVGKIKSPHFTKIEAVYMLDILEMFNEKEKNEGVSND